MSKKRDISKLTKQSEKHLSSVLDKEDLNLLKKLSSELKESWGKKQVFRTETEMRFSVLSDNKYPTKAAKYWQSVREQASHFTSLVYLSFDYRANETEIKKLEKKLKEEKDDLEKELLLIELDKRLFSKSEMELVGKNRIREVATWSKIKKELNDGTFDDNNVNVHQAQSYKLRLEKEAQYIKSSSDPSAIDNILGQLNTLTRLIDEGKFLTKEENKKIK